ncbi:MAG: type II toxin-antitoxin system VapC family toxin [bacterium]
MTSQPTLNLLDTHAWLWLMEGDARLDDRRVADLEVAASNGSLFVATLSLWEVAALESIGRVRFAVPVESWLHEALETPGLNLLEIDARVAAESVRLPGTFAGDPVDRLLVAAVRTHAGRLYTADHLILAYASEGYVDAVAVTSASA